MPGLSAELRAFVAESPLDRSHLVRVVQGAADALPAGARVLDAGAGNAPYRELFAHCEYVTHDWAASVHPGARAADVVAPLDDLPLEAASFDAVVCTQVLEHVADPVASLLEIARVLKPSGRLWLTVPFVGELHEEPYDFFRYTSHGLRAVAERAGLEVDGVEPLGAYFTTVAQTLRMGGEAIGVGAGAPLGRRLVAAGLRVAGRALPALDRLDDRRALPLGWALVARKGAG